MKKRRCSRGSTRGLELKSKQYLWGIIYRRELHRFPCACCREAQRLTYLKIKNGDSFLRWLCFDGKK